MTASACHPATPPLPPPPPLRHLPGAGDIAGLASPLRPPRSRWGHANQGCCRASVSAAERIRRGTCMTCSDAACLTEHGAPGKGLQSRAAPVVIVPSCGSGRLVSVRSRPASPGQDSSVCNGLPQPSSATHLRGSRPGQGSPTLCALFSLPCARRGCGEQYALECGRCSQ